MPKLYNIYLVDTYDNATMEEMLWLCDSVEEAEQYAKSEWEDLIDNYQVEIQVYEVTCVNGYEIQLIKKEA